RLANFIRRRANAESPFIPDWLLGFDIEFHKRCRKSIRQIWRYAADGAGLPLDVEQRNDTFGRAVEFQDLWNTEAGLKFVPDIWSQSVSTARRDSMHVLVPSSLAAHHVSANLVDNM